MVQNREKFDNFWRRSLKKDFAVDKNTEIRRVSGAGLKMRLLAVLLGLRRLTDLIYLILMCVLQCF